MGKASKKLNKKKNQSMVQAETKQINALKDKLNQQVRDMSYADALDTLAELIGKKCYEPDIIYQGAQIYFQMGDYERAASWVNNTLHYAPQHLEARLLLAKICVLEDRLDDAMALYSFVLQNYQAVLTDKHYEEIKEGTDYTWRTDQAWLLENYPLVANLWNEKGPQKLEKGKSESTDQVNNDDGTVADIVKQVFGKEISLTQKVQMLNKFAGGYFVAKDFANTQLLLEKALEIDSHNTKTLTNLAILAKMQGDMDKALAYVARMSEVDFVILQRIME